MCEIITHQPTHSLTLTHSPAVSLLLLPPLRRCCRFVFCGKERTDVLGLSTPVLDVRHCKSCCCCASLTTTLHSTTQGAASFNCPEHCQFISNVGWVGGSRQSRLPTMRSRLLVGIPHTHCIIAQLPCHTARHNITFDACFNIDFVYCNAAMSLLVLFLHYARVFFFVMH